MSKRNLDRKEATGLSDSPFDDGYLFRALLATTGDSVYVKDRDCRLVRVSRQMARNLGFSDSDELVGKSDFDLFPPDFAQRTYIEELRVMETDQPISGLIESRPLEDGSLNWTLTTKMPLRDTAGEIVGLLGVTSEINSLKQTETNLQYLATHDSLTGLPNRYLMMDRLSQVLARAEREQSHFAVIFVDLDDLKRLNDTLGHTVGDEILRASARRMRSTIRASDTLARIGGDEFVLTVDGADQQAAILVALKILDAVSAHAGQKAQDPKMTASVGIAVYPDHGRDGAGLVTAADHAMYLAKRSGKNGYFMFPATEQTLPAQQPQLA